MVEPALGVLHEVVDAYLAVRCETCGKPTGDPSHAIKAALAVLDRTGYHPSVKVEVEPPPKEDTEPTAEKLRKLLVVARRLLGPEQFWSVVMAMQAADNAIDVEASDAHP